MATEISRRTFIKGAAAAGVVLAAGSYFAWDGKNIPEKVKTGDVTYDVLVIGSGGAGMRAALAAAERKDLKVAVMTKLVPTRSASTMAQGGMNGVTGVSDPTDTVESHVFDTIKGGDYLCDQDAVEYFAERAGENIYEMDYMGYPYNRQKDGAFHQRKMGGHSHPRASYFEDRAGHAMVHCLFEQCLENNIDFISECQMLEISMDGDKLNGVIAMDMRSGNLIGVPAKSVIIATGGYGRVYWVRTSNPYSSTGDGIVAGMNVGIPFKDPEMVQFHPTGLSANGVLLSESSRAEGALLINKNGERFMSKYAPERMELATRDIVARAIATEIEQGRGVGEGIHAGVYMDFTKIPAERIHERLGQVYDLSRRFAGVDITKEPVPIAPTCHYSMGGLEMADFHTGESRVKGVYVAGECSCVSVHGANRLGANSLSEVLVFGHTAGDGAAEFAKANKYEGNQDSLAKACEKWKEKFDTATSRGKEGNKTVPEIRDAMINTMWYKVGVFREESQLLAATQELEALEKEYEHCYVGDNSHVYNTAFEQYVELGNLLQISHAIVQGALARKESRGGHSRRDFPKRDDANFLKHTLIFKDKETGKYRAEYKDVVITKYQPKERKY
ncbi:putative fumarate reductase flavoprotein subunit [Selenomonas ruminantium subsp. lactilytica TAM6421]|uniref:Putative fumarate reductase flavoprotein subunit n=1 Tax=Selenomonas ruminantium subsp. lactilytica (strain NBRC 103574 / TAM6421) TaxID=927704 RepID=I0GRU0_SELRL|nr:FAD-binding protein [Selenomonas ruminantium]BAL83477.1 putative fumarate reductase flavoprotein subunit [Selenomonas ruminantium subsp. lactilytica TAM6421]